MKNFAVFVIAAVFVISLFNFINQMQHAQNKELWRDEDVSLRGTIQGNSYLGLLLKADVITEANTAPLDYIFTKILDDLGRPFNYFDLSQKVYFRLWANFAMVFSGFVIVCLFIVSILRSSVSNPVRFFQLLLLVFLPFIYLYRPMTYHYAAEVRPYSLWFALWFISIAVCSMPRTNKFLLSVCLSLVALTLVGSIFQIVAVGIAYFFVRWQEDGTKQALKESLQIFSVPIALVVFYAFPAAYGHRNDEPVSVAWHRFYELWSHEWIIILFIMITIGLQYYLKREKAMSIGPLAVVIVFLMGPVICMTTLNRGYFVTERQYIYYDAHRAILWLALINLLPLFLDKIKDIRKQILIMVLLFAVSVPFIFPNKTLRYIKEVMSNAVGPTDHPSKDL